MTKLSNSNIASAKVQRSNYRKYQECKSPKIKLPKILRMQKVDKTVIPVLQVQKSKGQTTQNISRVQKVENQILQVQKWQRSRAPAIFGF